MSVLQRYLIPKMSLLKLVKSIVLFTMFSISAIPSNALANGLEKIDKEPSINGGSIVCVSYVQVSLDENGEFYLTPRNLLADVYPDYSIFTVKIQLPGRTNILYCSDIGKRINVKVTNNVTLNSCWSEVTVEDKLEPVINCQNDTLPCTTHPDSVDYYQYGSVADNCDSNVLFSMTHIYTDFNCSNSNFTGMTMMIWIAEDNYRNRDTCYSRVYFTKPSFTDVVYPKDTTMYCPNENLDEAGLPSIDGIPIIDLCDFGYFFLDDTTFICSGEYRVNRTWTLINICPPYQRQSEVQTIMVLDTTDPILICPDTVILGTSEYVCNLLYTFFAVVATDACSSPDSISQTIRLDGAPGFVPGDTITLDTGFHTLYYTVTDDCGNISNCTVTLHIVDDVLPVMICVPNDTIYLDSSGWVIIGTNRFIDLVDVFDNCGVDTVMARRMSTSCFGRESDTLFTNAVEFCCADVGEEVMIVIKATDVAGNMNFCMIRVAVLDTIPPTITSSPNDTMVSCTVNYLDTSITGGVKFIDNCPDDVTITVIDSNGINSCQEGKIKRTFLVCDKGMNCDTAVQIIMVFNPYTFDTSDVVWPPDTVIENCPPDSLPSTIGSMVEIIGDSCQVIVVTFSDSIISDTNDACLVILRKWEVLDTCSATTTMLDSIQMLTFLNYRPPVLSGPNDTIVYVNASSCEAFIQLDSVKATDCSSNVVIVNDYNNGGPDATDTFPVGDTTIIFTGTDNCGKTSIYELSISVRDTFPPALNCPPDTTLLCAFDFTLDSLSRYGDATFSDNCTLLEVTVDTINELGKCNAGTLTRRWIATDESGNADTCTQVITIIVDTLTEDNVNWPADTTITDCPADSLPSTIGSMATVDSNRCGNIKIRYEDTDVSDPNDVCLTIERRWIVTDSCSVNTPRLDSVQIINILNYGPPILTVPPDITLNTDPNDCGTNLVPPPATVTNCSSGVVIENDYTNGGPDASGFYPVGVTKVIFTATDGCGKVSMDSFFVTVIDDVDPVLICPPDTLVHCSTGFSIDSLDKYGVVMFSDNCDSIMLVIDTIQDLHTCGSGTVMRTWTATDSSGNRSTCSQLITVLYDTLQESDIIWPPDTMDVDVCDSVGLDSVLNIMPMIDSMKAGCFVLEITFEDSTSYSCGELACTTITRQWTIIDSCVYDSMNIGIFRNTSIIRIIDTVPPTIDSVRFDTTLIVSPDSCEKYVRIVASAADCSGVKYIHNNSPVGRNGDNDASGVYPLGVTLFYFATEDSCCNKDTLFVQVRILDTIPPTLTCSPAQIDLKFSEEEKHAIEVCPSDFNVSYADNCVERKDLIVTLNKFNPNDSCRIYNCDSLMGRSSRVFTIVIYVLDPINNAIDSCITTLTLTDEDNVCSMGLPSISGSIGTSLTMPLAGVEIHLDGSNVAPAITDLEGKYAFPIMSPGGTYYLWPSFQDDILRGVSTRDLLWIQRHLLGLKNFVMPEQYFAADVNGSGSVSTGDIAYLRKVILGKIEDFDGTDPWMFINADVQYIDEDNPFSTSIQKGYLVDSLVREMNINFKGIKIGDVDMTTGADYAGLGETRSAGDPITIDWRTVLEVDEIMVFLHVPELNKIEGVQFELQFDSEYWNYNGVAVEANNGLRENFVNQLEWDKDKVRISWDQWSGLQSAGDFVLSFKARNNTEKSFECALSTDRMPNEVYWQDGSVGDVRLVSTQNTSEEKSLFSVSQNRPNPFDDETEISFYIAEESLVDLKIWDMSGRVIKTSSRQYESGYHSIKINRNDLNGTQRIYFYQITTKFGVRIKKMLMTM